MAELINFVKPDHTHEFPEAGQTPPVFVKEELGLNGKTEYWPVELGAGSVLECSCGKRMVLVKHWQGYVWED